MASHSSPALGPTTKEHVQRTIQANKDHQAALKTYTARLEAELEALDKLLAAAEANDDDEPDLDVGGFVSVPGSTRATAPISLNELLSEESPFFEDAERRQRYLDLTGYHPMKAKELEDLAEAVRTENYRLYALQAQRRGQFSFTDLETKSAQFLEQNKDEIDWERVASTISSRSQSHLQRTPKECEIRWLGDRHPEFNHASWSQAETAQCRALVSEFSPGPVDWTKVAERLGTHRTPLDCMRHGLTRRTHVWTPEADQKLLDAIQVYGINNWLIVARLVSHDVTAQQCQNRFQRTLDPDLKRGPWSPCEDEKLRLGVAAYGNSWLEVANTIEGRNNEQCRDRWNEKLDPKINRNAWTNDEDERLLEAVNEVGEGKWKAVCAKLGNGRKDSACRTRYEVLKKRKGKERETPIYLDVSSDRDPEDPRPTYRGRTRDDDAVIDDSQAGVAATAPLPTKPRPRPRKSYKGKEREMGIPSVASGEDGAGPECVEPSASLTLRRPMRSKKHLEGGMPESEPEKGEGDVGIPSKGNCAAPKDSSSSTRKSISRKRQTSGKAPGALASGAEYDETHPRKKRRELDADAGQAPTPENPPTYLRGRRRMFGTVPTRKQPSRTASNFKETR